MPSFAALTDEFLDTEFADAPVRASGLGLTEYDDRLDDLSEAAFERRRARDTTWLERFRAGRSGAGSHSTRRIDRDLAISILRGRQIVEDFEVWRRQPDTYLNPGMSGIFALFLHRAAPARWSWSTRRSRACARSRTTSRTARRNLRPELVPSIFLDRAANQARAGARYVREILPAQVEDARCARSLAEAGEAAATAYEEYVEFLEEMRPARDRRLRARRGALHRAAAREGAARLRCARAARARPAPPTTSSPTTSLAAPASCAGTDDWKSVLDELNEDHPRDAGGDARRLRGVDRARPRVSARARLVSFPAGEECAVVPSPPFQRPGAGGGVVHVSRRRSATGCSAISSSPSRPTARRRTRSRSDSPRTRYPGIPTTAVHEAYPGHHWHLVMTQGAIHRACARSFRTPYFSEGWALYAERMMREQGFFTDLAHEMNQYEATIFRAARIVVDTSAPPRVR